MRPKQLNKKMFSILFIILLTCTFSSIFIQVSDAVESEVLSSSWSFTNTHTMPEKMGAVHPSDGSSKSGWYYTFTAYETGLLSKIRLEVGTVSPNGLHAQLKCAIYTSDGDKNSQPIDLLGTSSAVGIADNTEAYIQPFDFVGLNITLTSGVSYVFFVYLFDGDYVDNSSDYAFLMTDATFNSNTNYFGWYSSSTFSSPATYDEVPYEVYVIQGEPEPTPTPTPSPTETPDSAYSVLSSITTFIFGDGGVLGAGFGLLILLVCIVLCVKAGGRSMEMVLIGSVIATIVNVAIGIWETWTIILIIIVTVAIGLKNAGVIKGDGEE